jgi:hypothetical protein
LQFSREVDVETDRVRGRRSTVNLDDSVDRVDGAAQLSSTESEKRAAAAPRCSTEAKPHSAS